MKKLCLLLSILTVAAVAVSCATFLHGNFAYAAGDASQTSYKFSVDGQDVYVNNIIDENSHPIGARFANYYFGASGIAVSVDVYDSPALDLGFAIGSDGLNEAQLATRSALTQLFGDVHRYINGIDALANTGYDGSTDAQGNASPLSDVYRYNHAQKYGEKLGENSYRLQIDAETYHMLTIAKTMYAATKGAYNPAVYRLVDLWGFSSRIYSNGDFCEPYDREVTSEQFWNNGYPLPEEKYVEAFSDPAFTDFSDDAVTLSQSDGKYYVTKNVPPAVVDGVQFEQWIDLGGIAKGYVVDGVKAMLADRGIDRYNVNAGGSSMAYGMDYDGGSSVMGISDAFDPLSAIYPTALVDIEVANCSVSTSGQNVRKYVTDGVEYSHIMDGSTGEPAQTGVRSVTVVVPNGAGDNWAAMSDCLTTALTVLGRDGIVEMINGYFKEKGISVVVLYQTLDGKKQLLSNLDQSALVPQSDSYSTFGWALKKDADGNFYYDSDAHFVARDDVYRVWVIVLGCLLGAAAVALVVYHFVRGRKRTLFNVQHAKKDKPFRLGDILVYMGVVLVIAVLFAVFVLDNDDSQLQIVNVIDEQTGETLFVYNVQRNEYATNASSSNGWTVTVTAVDDGIVVRLEKDFDGEKRFNVLHITRGRDASVKMEDSLCGFHQDCVRNFAAVTRSGGAIVCSPNRLKVVTE